MSPPDLTIRPRATRPVLTAALLCLVCLLMSGCESNGGPRPEERVHRGKITLGVIHHKAASDAEEEPLLRLRDDRIEVELTRLMLVIADLEVHACDPPAPHASLLDLLIPSAHAHVPDSATRLGTPTVEDLLSPPAKARIIGEVAPPWGSYCALWVVVAPADEDVVNLSELPSEEILGKSALIAGRWRSLDAPEQWHPFDTTRDMRQVWRVMLPEPITLEAQHESAFVLVDKTLDAALLEGLDASDAEALTRALPDHLLEKLLAKLYRYSPRR